MTSLAWASFAFLGLISIMVAILRLRTYLPERKFRKDWEETVGQPWPK